MVQDSGSVANLVAETHLSKLQVRRALAYWKSHLAEIEQAIEENSRPLREWRELYPFVRMPAS